MKGEKQANLKRGIPMMGNTTVRCKNCYYWNETHTDADKGKWAPCESEEANFRRGSDDKITSRNYGCIFFEPNNAR